MPVVWEGEEETLVGEEENGVHEWGTQSHTCTHGLHNML